MPKIDIICVKSGIGSPIDQKKTLRALGLRRINQRVTHEDSPAVRGMIFKVQHLVKVEENTSETG